MTKQSLQRLVKQKLQSSGLTLDDAKALGIKTLTTQQADRLLPAHKPGVPALKLCYHTLEGKLRPDVYRVRVLDQPTGKFGESRNLRYLQAPNTPPAAYLPKVCDWRGVKQDPEVTLFITEGELKAACLSKHSYACIGLGGVQSWRSQKQGWPLLPEIVAVGLELRRVIIVFDSDVVTNPQVGLAAQQLSAELRKHGALPEVLVIPDLGDGKSGVDDLIVARGIEYFEAEILPQAKKDQLSQRLLYYNSRFCFVESPGAIYDLQEHVLHEPGKFHTSTFANDWAAEETVSDTGAPKLKKTKVAKAWLEHPQRRSRPKMTYAPGKASDVDGKLNAWTGFKVPSVKGDVSYWHKLMEHLTYGLGEQARTWLEQYLLYPIKHPGAKLLSAVVLWSIDQGLGKSCVGHTLAEVYGQNCSIISQQEIESQFNGWAHNKQLVVVDDVSSHDSRAKADILKKIITQTTIIVNIKGIPTFELPDHANYILTSNKPNAFYIDEKDRRFFIHEITGPRLGFDFFDEYYEWLREKGGAAALRYYAEHEMSYKGFYPYRPPPVTDSKEEMRDHAKTEVEAWLTELSKSPDHLLRVGQMKLSRDLFTSKELVELFEPHRKGFRSVTAVQMGMKAREYLGVCLRGTRVAVNGSLERLYVVRNQGKWSQATLTQVRKHVTTEREKEQGTKKGKF